MHFLRSGVFTFADSYNEGFLIPGVFTLRGSCVHGFLSQGVLRSWVLTSRGSYIGVSHIC